MLANKVVCSFTCYCLWELGQVEKQRLISMAGLNSRKMKTTVASSRYIKYGWNKLIQLKCLSHYEYCMEVKALVIR